VAMARVPVAVWCLSTSSPGGSCHEALAQVFYNMRALLLGVSVTKLPCALHLRALILPWIFYGLARSQHRVPGPFHQLPS
jgi:hypothetical protein